jgi:IS30 family transposase
LWNIIHKCHNADVGHWGVNRTLELIQETLERDPTLLTQPWPAMRRDAETYIHKCDSCIKTSEQKIKHMTRKYVTSSYGVFENIAIDALAMEVSKNGFNHLLTIIDTATRYVVLKPLKDLTARSAAQAIIEYMCVYGVPMHITSDNSTEFKKEFEEMVEILKAENYKIQAYSHEENSMVERANKEVRRHLRVLTYENRTRKTWDIEYLKVQAILNEKVSEATGLKPNEIVFAGKVNLHEGRIYPRPTEQQRQRMSDFMKEQIELQEHLIESMEEKQEQTDELHMKTASETIQLLVGTYIVCRHE